MFFSFCNGSCGGKVEKLYKNQEKEKEPQGDLS